MNIPINLKINKYLDKKGKYNPMQSEAVRQAYKKERIKKENVISKFIDCIFKEKQQPKGL